LKVFLSWSGELSKHYAEVLHNWLPCVLQAVEPYFSASDIEKGQRWSSSISQELASSSVGIICLTRENLSAPWIMFEAGALAKALNVSKVTPLLFEGLKPTDIAGPLAQFQAAVFSKSEIIKLVESLNESLGDKSINSITLLKTIERWWPDLESRISEKVASQRFREDIKLRDDRSLVEETLELVREIYYDMGSPNEVAPLLLKPVEELKLGSECLNFLHKNNIYYVGDLVKLPETTLRSLAGGCDLFISELKQASINRGLKLGMRIRSWPPLCLKYDSLLHDI